MARLSDAVIADYARLAGFRGDGLLIAISIALAESGGNPAATHKNKDKRQTVDRGLYQINSYWHREVSDAEAFDPLAASKAAFRISKEGTNWRQWATYSNGAWLMYKPRALKAVGGDPNAGTTDVNGPEYNEDGSPVYTPTGGDVINPDAQSVGSGLADKFAWLGGLGSVLGWLTDSDNWKRIGLVLAGLFAIIVAVVIIRADELKAVAPDLIKLAAVA